MNRNANMEGTFTCCGNKINRPYWLVKVLLSPSLFSPTRMLLGLLITRWHCACQMLRIFHSRRNKSWGSKVSVGSAAFLHPIKNWQVLKYSVGTKGGIISSQLSVRNLILLREEFHQTFKHTKLMPFGHLSMNSNNNLSSTIPL